MNPEALSKKFADVKTNKDFAELRSMLQRCSKPELFSVLFSIASDYKTYPWPVYSIDTMTYTENKNLHDSLRAHFQTVDVKHLNTVLIENGLNDLELRKQILEDYFFTAGQFFDAGWFEAHEKKYSAIVCFREVDADLRRSDKMICPDAGWGTIFHEMAIGTTEMVAEDPDDENVQVRTGEIAG